VSAIAGLNAVTRVRASTSVQVVAGMPAVVIVPAVACIPSVAGESAVTHLNGLIYHINEGMTVKFSVRHLHLYRHSVPLVRHRPSDMSLSPISPITEHCVIAQL